ncbi:MAG TPA: MobF family relaxase [Methylotenera sp.]|nr:MobF family relaxase [Methylotenera sp.]HPH06093.1 MobF family relaxase [Methylotenera sp.]
MISMSKISNVSYHLEHSQHDYYSENDNEKGIFKGSLMRFQKLENKEVTENKYLKMIEHGGEDNKGVDICFSPPKDWTLIYNLVDSETRLKMDGIRDKAVNNICKAIEQNTYIRKTENGKTSFELAKATGMAIFNHHTSREVNDKDINPLGIIDPQEHTHITVFPKSLGKDGQFHSHTLLQAKYEKNNGHETLKYFDSVGQLELAKGLQELGFNIEQEDKHGNFKVKGITDDLRDNFSKRTQQIDKLAGESATYNEKKNISLKVRAKKDSHNLEDLRTYWQSNAKDLGFDIDKLQSIKSNQKDNHKSFSEIMKDNKAGISLKKLKTIANNQAKFSTKSSKEIFEEYKNDKKLTSITKQVMFYSKNSFIQKQAENYKISSANNAFKKISNKNNNISNNKDTKQSKPTKTQSKPLEQKFNGLMNNINKPKNNIDMALGPARDKNEILSNLKNLEDKLFLLDPKAEDFAFQFQMLMQQIGMLKTQLMAEEKSNKAISNEDSVSNIDNSVSSNNAESSKEADKSKHLENEERAKRQKEFEEKLELNKHLKLSLNEYADKLLDFEIKQYIDNNLNDLTLSNIEKISEINEQQLQDKLLELEENKDNLTDGKLNNELNKHLSIHSKINNHLNDKYKVLSLAKDKTTEIQK